MKILFKEPLLHFFALGCLLFATHAWRKTDESSGESTAPNRVVVNAETITRLKDGWSRQFQRSPDAADIQGLVEAHISEEILYREALKLGLDRNDTIVRRRLAQKMEFLTQDIANAAAPDEATLTDYFTENKARYARPTRVSFKHVYFSEEKRGKEMGANAKEALTALAQPGVSDEAFGDGFLQGFEFSEQNEQEIATVFGPEFATAVVDAPEGVWSGPVTSSYGTHLVLVTARGEPAPAEFSEVRALVLLHLLEERRLAANAEVITEMMKNYEIEIDESALKAASVDLAKAAESKP